MIRDRLALRRETIRVLTDLRVAHGGMMVQSDLCQSDEATACNSTYTGGPLCVTTQPLPPF